LYIARKDGVKMLAEKKSGQENQIERKDERRDLPVDGVGGDAAAGGCAGDKRSGIEPCAIVGKS
jgi:hypothetical protein